MPKIFKSGECYLNEVARQRLAIFLFENIKQEILYALYGYKSMSLKKKPNTLLLNTIIECNMNKRSELLFQKSNFSPPGSDKFLNFIITPPKTFQLSLEVAGKENTDFVVSFATISPIFAAKRPGYIHSSLFGSCLYMPIQHVRPLMHVVNST